ncbi:SIR2 family protein [Tsukamurella paurometabola]|uniref:SIR2 family protein n=1 Tax=Tsukamurella paurometabola TaxID=2061 RepID=A0ABS5NKC5_TSUPA|nr:SIR2 family protein [Tsukamurella paurometabola]
MWTLNVDDAYENAYRDSPLSRSRPYSTRSFVDQYTESGELQIVHLHGHILGKDPSPLVFSFSDYQRVARVQPVWHQVLSDVMPVEPFVVIGARMLDDPDIEALLRNRSLDVKTPSVVVDPYISDGNKWELEQYGYSVLKMKGEEFVDYWRGALDIDEGGARFFGDPLGVAVPQFVRLETNRAPEQPRGQDYFGGDIPTWNDALSNRIALMDWANDGIRDIEQWLDGPAKPRLRIIYSDRLTGVTSGVLAIARQAAKFQVRVWKFDRSSRWDSRAILEAARGLGPALFLVESAADYSDDIDKTLKLAAMEEIPIYFLCSEMRWNALRMEERLSGNYSKSMGSVPADLKRSDARALSRKLEEFGRLGVLEAKPAAARVGHFVGRDVFSAMLDVEYSMGFRKRLDGELQALAEPWQYELVLLLSLAAQVARPVGIVDAARAINVSVVRIGEALRGDGHLSALVQLRGNEVAARQRDRAAEPVRDILGSDQSLGFLISAIHRLSPMSSRSSLHSRNKVPMLVAHLMTCKNLVRTFPEADLDLFYDELRPIFGSWNGRYWEQWAIYAKSTQDWGRAESFAARAVSMYDDAFTRTTLGTILLNKSEALARLGDVAWQGFFERGVKELRVAQGSDSGGRRVAYFALLTASLSLMDALARAAGGDNVNGFDKVATEFSETYAVLRVTLVGEENLETARRAEKLSERYERILGSVRRDRAT